MVSIKKFMVVHQLHMNIAQLTGVIVINSQNNRH